MQSTDKKKLVICSYGEKHRVDSWLNNLPSSIDTALIYYGTNKPHFVGRSKYHYCHSGYKLVNFCQLIDAFPNLIREYEEFLFLDDDLILTSQDIERIFEIAGRYRLDFWGPAFTADSITWWPHQKQRHISREVLSTNFIEVGAFGMNRDFLRLCLPFFYMGRTGNGFDVACSWLAELHQKKIGLINAVAVHHPLRPESETVRATGLHAFWEESCRRLDRLAFIFDKPTSLEEFKASVTLGPFPAYPLLLFNQRRRDARRKLGRLKQKFKRFLKAS